MLKFVFEKIINKKWMVISLLIGGVLLVGIAACNPMYVNGALQKLLVSNLDIEYASTGEYPIMVESKKAFNTKGGNFQSLRDSYINNINEEISILDLEVVSETEYYHGQYFTMISSTHPEESISDVFVELGYIKDMENHINIISGRMNTDNIENDNTYQVIVSEAAFNKLNLVLDEVITMESSMGTNEEPIKLKVVGVYEAKEEGDLFWVMTPSELEGQCFFTENGYTDVNNNLFPEESTYGTITVEKYVLYDYSKIKYNEIYNIAKSAEELINNKYTCNFVNKFKDYSDAKNKITSTMNILQVPTFFLLAIFIYMVSSQMLSMEANEIAMLKSRGASRIQIIFTYLLQSSLLATVSLVIGIPVGYIFCKVVGVSNSFMEFVGRKALPVSINLETIGYAIVAALFLILVMTLPVIPISKTTIVEHKQKKNANKALWKKLFLDAMLFILAIYGCYNFNQQKEVIIKKIIEGSAIDPLLFLCSSLFILSCAMIAVRIIPIVIWVIYRIGKSKWSTATYTAFLQIIRTTEKQDFIIIFLVLTIAFGIFNANTARTININEENRIWNTNGADLVIKEEWKNNKAEVIRAKLDGVDVPLVYEEPDIWKYQELSEDMEEMTKVFNEIGIKAKLTGSSKVTLDNVQLMGINTKEFGETAWMRDGALDKHWYYYLNDMASDTNSILVSSNMRDKLGVKIGDTISYTRYNELGKISGTGNGIVCGFVDAWPGYVSLYEKVSKDGSISYEEQYLIVANFDQVMSAFSITPYEIWIKNKDNTTYMYDYITDNNIRLVTFNDSENDLVKMKNDPIFQETNGMLTISFIIVLILCTVGFLIYWIFSIKSRELLFGIYRAMGLSLKEIIKMLLFEHLFSSVFAIVIGIIVGVIATYLFVPLIELAYSVNLLDSNVYMSSIDMIRLAVVIIFMLAICMYILGKLLSTLKISQALKLGEE